MYKTKINMVKAHLVELEAKQAAYEQAQAEKDEAIVQAEAAKSVYELAYHVERDGIKPIANPDSPYPIEYGMPVIPNLYYTMDGTRYVCMPENSTSTKTIVLTEENFADIMVEM